MCCCRDPARVSTERFSEDSATKRSVRRDLDTEDVRNRRRDVRITYGRLIDISALEVRSYRSHIVERGIASESTMHTLPMLLAGVRHLDSCLKITRTRIEHLESDDESRTRNGTRPNQSNRT